MNMTQRTHFVAAGLVHRNVEAQHKCHQPKYEHEDLPASHTLPPHGVDGDLCAHVLNGKTRIQHRVRLAGATGLATRRTIYAMNRPETPCA